MKLKLIVALTAAISLSGCASIIKGSNQDIAFNTGDVEGATCVVTGGSKNEVNDTVVTPGVLELPRSKKALLVNCTKPGMGSGTKSVKGNLEPWLAGNLLFGGLPGITIDAFTGSIHKYPGEINVTMVQEGIITPTVTGEPIT